MKIVKLTLILLLIAGITNAQGVRFITGLSWDQVKAKAKEEGKYIFMDCYATWCGPCKNMDKYVYPDAKVGDYFNAHFISVRVQMDVTKGDNEEVKSWYAEARKIAQEYNVTAYPTFMFFSPEGKALHRDAGYKYPDEFIKLASDVFDPEKQYYTLLESYEQGKLPFSKMPPLAYTARQVNEKEIAKKVAHDYLNNYLYKQDDATIYSKENIQFMHDFVRSSSDKGFTFYYDHADKIDAIAGKSAARAFVDFIITTEEIEPSIKAGSEGGPAPDWEKITKAITKKYSRDYAERNVMNAKLGWYDSKKDWPNLVKYSVLRTEKYGVDTSTWGRVGINNMAFSILFEHSNDKKILNKAIKWMEIILHADPNDFTAMDTYANLLYKTGRTSEAIAIEEKALVLSEQSAAKYKQKPDPVFPETLARMKKGEPTWGQTYNNQE